MKLLDSLRDRLAAKIAESDRLRDAESLLPLLAKLRRQVSAMDGGTIPENAQREVLSRFWDEKRIESFKDARIVAFGLAVSAKPNGLSILEDSERFGLAIAAIDQWNDNARAFSRCYLGLTSSFFAYNRASATDVAAKNLENLREYLGNRISAIGDTDNPPRWVQLLRAHPELLTARPCGILAREHTDEYIDELRANLRIDNASWFSEELFIARIEAACEQDDAAFVTSLPNLIEHVRSNLMLHHRGLGLILNRYAEGSSFPLHVELRQHAVFEWGNPWLPGDIPKWGFVNTAARGMLSDWLKLEFIESFFTLLSEDGQSDPRRMNFWRHYVPAIKDIRFALGSDAWYSHAKDLVQLKKRAAGLTIVLHAASPTNNAFIMTIHGHVVVEFSGRANATYIYKNDGALPFDATRPVQTTKNAANSLKNDACELRLRHQDGILGFPFWENMFAYNLEHHCGIAATSEQATRSRTYRTLPQQAVVRESTASYQADSGADWSKVTFSNSALARLATEYGLTIEDKRTKGGNLWVRNLKVGFAVAEILRKWGFRFKRDAGWWLV